MVAVPLISLLLLVYVLLVDGQSAAQRSSDSLPLPLIGVLNGSSFNGLAHLARFVLANAADGLGVLVVVVEMGATSYPERPRIVNSSLRFFRWRSHDPLPDGKAFTMLFDLTIVFDEHSFDLDGAVELAILG